MSSYEAGEFEIKRSVFDLDAVVGECVQTARPTAEQKEIELKLDTDPVAEYSGDRDRVGQLFDNLLSNAIKYTPDKGRVALRSRLEDNQVRFEVQDTGVGLSEEDCQRVFEKFYRVGKDKNMAAGTGLGLPLAKHIVEDVHGGSLSAESTLGEGSTFAVTLPSAGQLTGQPA
ncbi:hypothetical protein LCGC14_2998940 [marine sediment metagenome]|uniref:histidine kinase n=1 Tax=marine sediment metagenome TaxID=412755 RepID=A0A0F8X1M6_9ZZZZ